MLDISGLDKADVLAALYNASKPLGMGFLHFDPAPMTGAQAREFIGDTTKNPDYIRPRQGLYFDYLKGRVMKVDLSKDEFNPAMYDRDNGDGAAARVIESLRARSVEPLAKAS